MHFFILVIGDGSELGHFGGHRLGQVSVVKFLLRLPSLSLSSSAILSGALYQARAIVLQTFSLKDARLFNKYRRGKGEKREATRATYKLVPSNVTNERRPFAYVKMALVKNGSKQQMRRKEIAR